jgi:hypothetical protein
MADASCAGPKSGRRSVEYVREAQIPHEKTYVADETGVVRTMDAGVLREGDNRRDIGMVELSAAGRLDATFLAHQKQRMRQRDGQTGAVEKGVSGMGTKQTSAEYESLIDSVATAIPRSSGDWKVATCTPSCFPH